MKNFTKEDLKPGMLVKTRNHGYMHVFDTEEGLCVSNNDDFCSIGLYNDELKCNGVIVTDPDFDIMEVWGLANSAVYSYKLSFVGRDRLWKREEESEKESNDEKTVDMYVNGEKIGELDWRAGFTFTDLYGVKTIVDPDSDDDEVEEDDFDDELFDDDDLEDFMKDNLGSAMLLGLAAGIAKVIEDSVKNDDKEGK